MPYDVINGFVELGNARVAEIRGWARSDSGSKVDTSIIGTGRKRSKPGIAERTLNLQLYFDDTDPQQSQIRQGAQGLTFTVNYGGPGSYQEVLNDCSIDSLNRTGQALDGYVEADAAISVSGEVVEGTA